MKDNLVDVLQWYRNKPGTKKWTDIVKALETMGNYDLASRVPQTGESQ